MTVPSPLSGSTAWSKISSVVKMLSEYKELAATIAFVIGGIFWVFAYFATRAQLNETRCIMNANIGILQGKLDSFSLTQLLLQNLQDSASLDGKTSLTASEMLKRSQLKTAAEQIGRKLAAAETATAEALNKLQSGSCSSEK